ncbi:MAG TPA: hypothetical protein VIT62_14560 [Lysobacter sp.]
MSAQLSDRMLAIAIHRTTVNAGSRSRKRSDLPGAIAFLVVALVICAGLLWADQAFV